MKYIKKIPEENEKYTEELLKTGWKKLKEPSLTTSMMISFPISIFLIFLNIKYLQYFFSPLKEIMNNRGNGFVMEIKLGIWKLIFYLLMTIVFFILHEFVHLMLMPNFLKSERTFWGMRATYFFAFTEEEMSKFRMMTVLIAPLVLLSFILPVFLNMLGIMNGFTVFLCIVNAGGSYLDVFFIILILFRIPNGSIVKNNGVVTFYKKI